MGLDWMHGEDFINQELDVIPFYIHPIIPGDGIVLFHGSPGIGKSTIMWQMMNNLQTGETFLGMKVKPTKSLLINLDMPKIGVYNRWKESKFEPKFDIAFSEEFNCLKAGFKAGKLYQDLAAIHEREKYGVICVDALGRVINASMNNDELPNQVYATFTQWFPHAAIIFIHHDRKRKQKEDGSLAQSTEEDFLGSQYWKAFAAIQLHLYKMGDNMVRLSHVKSQLGKLMDYDLSLYMSEDGTQLEEWSEYKQKEEASKLYYAEQRLSNEHPGWATLSMKQKVELLSKELGKSVPTIYRWKRSLANSKLDFNNG